MRYTRSEAKSWVKNSLRRNITCITTPFKQNLDIDEEGLHRNVEYVLSLPGVGGIYVHSVYQEFWTLTIDERKRVTEIVIEAVNGRAPVMVGTSHTSARETVNLSKHAQEAGADLLMVWPPYYGTRTDDGVRAFFEYLAERVDLGICLYSSTFAELGYFLTPDLVAKLAEIDNICAVKESSWSIPGYAAMMEQCAHLLSISMPLEEYHFLGLHTFGPQLVPKFLLGASRPIWVQSKERPLCGDYFDAIDRGDFKKAGECVRTILRISQALLFKYILKGSHNTALIKHVTGLHGMAAGPVRPPLSAPPQEQLDEAIEVLVSEKLLPASARRRS